ncbi:MAG: glycosyltransferase family 2 protein [Bacteroidia bacterium]|nr:glycosyltransferase family 2 protein [Bacteroidia bacterium]
MSKLSVVIITFNEERNIGRCLASVQQLADEIVVVDSGSEDQTEAICRQYGARFILHPFEGHIEQKNFALDQALYDNVLALDADEEVSPGLHASILHCVHEGLPNTAYRFNRLSNYCGSWIRHGSWYPDIKLRLFCKSKARWGGVNPHDKVELLHGGTAKWIKGDLFHYSYLSVNEHIKKLDYFSDIAAGAYLKEGKRAGMFKILFRPCFAFIRDYILRRGFLDGFAGYQIARLTA